MSRADYAHWNEDADYMWWHEEGKHVEEPPEFDDYDDDRPSAWDERDDEDDDDGLSDPDAYAAWKNGGCTCTRGSVPRHGGGTTTEIVQYDPKCPEHGDWPEPDGCRYGDGGHIVPTSR